MKIIWTLLFIFGIFLLPLSLDAQSITTDISIDAVPTNPEPGATVTLTATSYSADLSQATLVWTYNNVIISKGTGKTSVSVIAPASGATGVVSVTANGVGLTGESASLVLRPASIDMLWEAADAYTPPFYKGKALLPVNGLIRFTAVPSATAPRGLSFSWSRNGSALPESSGYNKSSVTFTHDEFNKQEMVEVSAAGGVFSGNGIVRVSPLASPTLVAYQNKEGFIDYAHGYNSTIPFTQSGIVLHFEPYYFSVPRSISEDLSFALTIDDQQVTTPQQNEVGLSRPNSAVRSMINVAITTVSYSLQHLEKDFTLLFN